MEDPYSVQMNDIYNEADSAKYIKAYRFIKGYALGKGLPQTLMALPVGRKFHDGQYRKSGEPYFTHPLKVCSTLISLGVDDDITLAAAILHNALEDCPDSLPEGGWELTAETAQEQLAYSSGAIVGSCFKGGGITDHPVDEKRVQELIYNARL